MCIAGDGADVDDRQQDDEQHGQQVEGGETPRAYDNGDTGERREEHDDHAGQCDEDAELGGAKFGVGQAEFALQVGVDADVDGHEEVEDEDGQRQVEVHQWRQACPDEHQGFVDAVDGVVEVVAEDGPLGVADAGQGAIEGVAVPVHHQACHAEP